jgi:phosphodiesterase/alkaline phosphatase D-like protein
MITDNAGLKKVSFNYNLKFQHTQFNREYNELNHQKVKLAIEKTISSQSMHNESENLNVASDFVFEYVPQGIHPSTIVSRQ